MLVHMHLPRFVQCILNILHEMMRHSASLCERLPRANAMAMCSGSLQMFTEWCHDAYQRAINHCRRLRISAAAGARRDVPRSWLLRKFRRGGKGMKRMDGVRTLTLDAPFGTLLGLGDKTVESISRYKGNRKKLLHANGAPKWWVICQRRKRTKIDIHHRFNIARKQIAQQRGICDKIHGIVAVVRFSKVIDMRIESEARTRAENSKRYRPWLLGVKDYAVLIDRCVHIHPPIQCVGNQGAIALDDNARWSLIARLEVMGRLNNAAHD